MWRPRLPITTASSPSQSRWSRLWAGSPARYGRLASARRAGRSAEIGDFALHAEGDRFLVMIEIVAHRADDLFRPRDDRQIGDIGQFHVGLVGGDDLSRLAKSGAGDEIRQRLAAAAEIDDARRRERRPRFPACRKNDTASCDMRSLTGRKLDFALKILFSKMISTSEFRRLATTRRQ